MKKPIAAHKEIAPRRSREQSGLYFEDFDVGDIFEHRPGRTITEADNIWISLLTMNPQPLHFDVEFAKKTEWKRCLVDSTITLAILTGMSVRTISGKLVANLGWDKVRVTHPLFAGDTLYAESEIIAKRPSKSRPKQGIVTVRTRGFNQKKELVMEFERTVLVYKRGHSPEAAANY